MKNRIEELKKHYGLSTRALAIKCGLNQPTLDRMLKGINALNLHCVISILESFPEISAEWLMRGVGEMINKTSANLGSEQILRLADTIALMQESLNDRQGTINSLTERIKQLENQLKIK